MKPPRRRNTGRQLAAVASALLWGVVELVALARSRWAMRLRHERDMPSAGHRG